MSFQLPTHEEMHSAYQQGEEAVMALFDQLVTHIHALEARVKSVGQSSLRYAPCAMLSANPRPVMG